MPDVCRRRVNLLEPPLRLAVGHGFLQSPPHLSMVRLEARVTGFVPESGGHGDPSVSRTGQGEGRATSGAALKRGESRLSPSPSIAGGSGPTSPRPSRHPHRQVGAVATHGYIFPPRRRPRSSTGRRPVHPASRPRRDPTAAAHRLRPRTAPPETRGRWIGPESAGRWCPRHQAVATACHPRNSWFPDRANTSESTRTQDHSPSSPASHTRRRSRCSRSPADHHHSAGRNHIVVHSSHPHR